MFEKAGSFKVFVVSLCKGDFPEGTPLVAVAPSTLANVTCAT